MHRIRSGRERTRKTWRHRQPAGRSNEGFGGLAHGAAPLERVRNDGAAVGTGVGVHQRWWKATRRTPTNPTRAATPPGDAVASSGLVAGARKSTEAPSTEPQQQPATESDVPARDSVRREAPAGDSAVTPDQGSPDRRARAGRGIRDGVRGVRQRPRTSTKPSTSRRAAVSPIPTTLTTTSLIFHAPPVLVPSEEPERAERGERADHSDRGDRASDEASSVRRRTRRRTGEAPREGDDAPNTVVRVRQPRQQPAHHRAAARQGLDPARGQEAAPPRRT